MDVVGVVVGVDVFGKVLFGVDVGNFVDVYYVFVCFFEGVEYGVWWC